MNPEHIQHISQSIEAVVMNINHFAKTVAFYSSSTLNRINNGLIRIKQLVKDDIHVMESMVYNYKETYQSFLAAKIDHLLHFLDSVDYNLDQLLVRTDKGPWDFSNSVKNIANRGHKDYGWYTITHLIGLFDALRVSLSSIDDINMMVPTEELDDSVKKELPSTLWSNNEQWRTCSQVMIREADKYRHLVVALFNVLHSWQESNKESGWPGSIKTRIRNRKEKIESLKMCASDYKYNINNALSHLSVIKSSAEDTVNRGTNFDFQAFQYSLKEDFRAMSASGSWLYRQLYKYRSYDISKLDLTKNILNAKTKDDMVRHMEAILFKTDLDAIFKLKTEAQILKSNIQQWYVAGLGAISPLVNYFEGNEVESKIRNLSLWRQPVLDVRTPEVLKYSYNFDETWRTWPASVPLRNLTTPHGSQYISDILEGYITSINDVLYQVQHTSLAAKEAAVVEIDTLWKELQSYKRLSQVDDQFVR